MIRLATASDCDLVWRIRNAEDVRAVSFETREIDMADHARWYLASLQNPRRRLFIISDAGGQGIGYVRVDYHGPLGYVSIAIRKDMRHKGFGQDSLGELTKAMTGSDLVWLVALIKPPNPASHGCFVKAGYDLAYHDSGVLTMLVKPLR